MTVPELTPASVTSITKALREFGYNVGEDEIRAGGKRLLEGKEPQDIIQMFMRGMLKDAGLLPNGSGEVAL